VWVDVRVDPALLETLLDSSYREVASKKLIALLDAQSGRKSKRTIRKSETR
jgi:hypothetical protein